MTHVSLHTIRKFCVLIYTTYTTDEGPLIPNPSLGRLSLPGFFRSYTTWVLLILHRLGPSDPTPTVLNPPPLYQKDRPPPPPSPF